MNNAFGMTNTTPHCERCGRPFKDGDDDASLWNIRFDAGSPRGHICPRCQTGIDSLEADINAIELESNGVRPLNAQDWTAMSEERLKELIHQTIEMRSRTVIASHREKAEMAGETYVAVDVDAWAFEALEGAQLFEGQPQKVRDEARAAAAEVIRQMLQLDN